jgi:hypothetical protein
LSCDAPSTDGAQEKGAPLLVTPLLALQRSKQSRLPV